MIGRRAIDRALLAAGLALILGGCRPSTDEVGDQVRVLLQQKLDQQPEFRPYHLVVSKVDVVREEGNKYQGIADVVMNGKDHSVPLKILDDGRRVMYETDPGAFLFVAQESYEDTLGAAGGARDQVSPAPRDNPAAAKTQPGGVIGEFDSSPQ